MAGEVMELATGIMAIGPPILYGAHPPGMLAYQERQGIEIVVARVLTESGEHGVEVKKICVAFGLKEELEQSATLRPFGYIVEKMADLVEIVGPETVLF